MSNMCQICCLQRTSEFKAIENFSNYNILYTKWIFVVMHTFNPLLLFATIDDYLNSLNPDQTQSNSASDLDTSCLATRQKVPSNLKNIGRYLKMKQTIY